MYSYNNVSRYSIDFYTQPEIVYTPESEQQMNIPKPVEDEKLEDKKLEIIEEIVEPVVEFKEKIEKKENKEHQDINDFQKIKNKFLNVKNKSAFIKRNKDKIKSLIPSDQKQFIHLAKSYFENI